MSSGLRYETGRDMSPGMAEKVAVQIARRMVAAAPAAAPDAFSVADGDVTNKNRLFMLLSESNFMDYDKQVNYLIANGVTVLTEDEQRNIYSVQEIEDLQNEAYDLGVVSALHNHFGLSWEDAAGLRKEIKRLQDESKWIPVTERPPKKGKYLCYIHSRVFPGLFYQFVLKYENGEFIEEGSRITKYVTHWMPLPQPPKEDTE